MFGSESVAVSVGLAAVQLYPIWQKLRFVEQRQDSLNRSTTRGTDP